MAPYAAKKVGSRGSTARRERGEARAAPDERPREGEPRASSDIEIDDADVLPALAGPRREKLKALERVVHVTVGERGHIEVAPLAFVRDRTLDDSIVLLDEAQGHERAMRMSLTRLGNEPKAVVASDVTQIGRPEGRASSLAEAHDLLDGVDGIAFFRFSDVDVVRRPLVQKIILRCEARGRERRP